MKKFTKFIVITLMIAIISSIALSFVACGGNTYLKKDTHKPKKGDKYLTLATNAEFAPWEYIDKKGNYAGIDMKLIEIIGKELGYDYIIVKDMAFDGIVASISTNTYDLGMAGITITDARKESVLFSTPYFETSLALIVAKDDTRFDIAANRDELIALLNDSHTKVGYAIGQTAGDFINGTEDAPTEIPKAIVHDPFDTVPLAIQGLNKGLVNAVITDKATADAVTKKSGIGKVVNVLISKPEELEQYGIAFRKNLDPKLIESINAIIDRMKKDGSLNELILTESEKASK